MLVLWKDQQNRQTFSYIDQEKNENLNYQNEEWKMGPTANLVEIKG